MSDVIQLSGSGGGPMPSTGILQAQIDALAQAQSFQANVINNPSNSVGAPVAITGYVASTGVFGAHGVQPWQQPIGIIARAVSGGLGFQHAVIVQRTGQVTLATAEWDIVTGGSGGLTPLATYYVGGPGGGTLSLLPIGAQIGVALDATTLVLQIGPAPRTIQLDDVSNDLAVGLAAITDEPGDTIGWIQAVSSQPAQGIVVDLTAGVATVQTEGLVALAGTAWTAAGVPGLTYGTKAYVATTNNGQLVNGAPVASGTYQTLVGRGLIANVLQLILSAPIGPHA